MTYFVRDAGHSA